MRVADCIDQHHGTPALLTLVGARTAQVRDAERLFRCQTVVMNTHVEVPFEALSKGALEGLVEEFITREGTDYGAREHSLDEKRASVLALLARRDVVILFDVATETTTLIRREELSATIVAAATVDPEEP